MEFLAFLLLFGWGGSDPPAHYLSNASHFRHLTYIPKPRGSRDWCLSVTGMKDLRQTAFDPRDISKHRFSGFATFSKRLDESYLSLYTGWGSGEATIVRGNNPPFLHEFKSYHLGVEWSWSPELKGTNLRIQPFQLRLGFTHERGAYRERVEQIEYSNYLKGGVEDVDPDGMTYQSAIGSEFYYSFRPWLGVGTQLGLTRESTSTISFLTTYLEISHVGITAQWMNPVIISDEGFSRFLVGGYVRF